MTVPYSTEGGGDAPKAIMEELKATDSIIFQEMSKGDLDDQVSEGKSSLGLILGDDDYTIIASADTPNVPQINQIVRKAYRSQTDGPPYADRDAVHPEWEGRISGSKASCPR